MIWICLQSVSESGSVTGQSLHREVTVCNAGSACDGGLTALVAGGPAGPEAGTGGARETDVLALDTSEVRHARFEDRNARFVPSRARASEVGPSQGTTASCAERPTSASSCESLLSAPGGSQWYPVGDCETVIGHTPSSDWCLRSGSVPTVSPRDEKQGLQFMDVAVKPRQAQYKDAAVHSGVSSGRTSTLGDLPACQGGEEKLWDLLATDTMVPRGGPYQDHSSKFAAGVLGASAVRSFPVRSGCPQDSPGCGCFRTVCRSPGDLAPRSPLANRAHVPARRKSEGNKAHGTIV